MPSHATALDFRRHVAREFDIHRAAFVGFFLAEKHLQQLKRGRKHEQRNAHRKGKSVALNDQPIDAKIA